MASVASNQEDCTIPETPTQQSNYGKEASVSATGCETECAVKLAVQLEEKRDDLGRAGSNMIGNSGELTTLKSKSIHSRPF